MRVSSERVRSGVQEYKLIGKTSIDIDKYIDQTDITYFLRKFGTLTR